MSKKKYDRKTGCMNRSYDFVQQAGAGDPWQLLASAIIFQAAVDCDQWTPEIEQPCYNSSHLAGLQYRRRGKLLEFINSDWIDMLLSWQTDVRPEAVCEELVRRLSKERSVS